LRSGASARSSKVALVRPAPRRALRAVLSAACLAPLALAPTSARADDGSAGEAVGLRGPRLGITPGIGGGVAGFTAAPAVFPSFVATTVIHIEAIFELPRWGFFLRGAYMSSGQAGRWTAPEAAAGVQLRLAGDGETSWGFGVRLGAIYERWSASAAGCDVTLFIPQNCQYYVAPPPGAPIQLAPVPSITLDALGLLAAARLELPVEPVLVAFGAELAALANVDGASPGSVLTGQLTITFALRDHPNPTVRRPAPYPRGIYHQ
jgi:hypothetical protein